MRFPPFTFRDHVLGARLGPVASYLWGAVVGVAFAVRVIGWPFLSGDPSVVRLVAGDNAAGLAAFRVYVEGGWTWPILYTPDFGTSGVNVAFSDSIPLLALVAKVAGPFGVAAETWWGGWFLAVYLLQGVAAVFAVRAWGGRSAAVSLAAPILAVAMPILAVQTVHPSLSAHFVLLLAWGLAGRARSSPRDGCVPFSALVLVAMAIHPYLSAMVLAMMAGVAIDAARREHMGRRSLVVWFATTGGTLGLWLVAGGYLGSAGSSEGGYGLYAIAVTGPFWPNVSDLLGPDPVATELLPTQAGYSYLGLGLGVLGAIAVVLNAGRVRSVAEANQGFLLVLLGLSAWAISPWVHIGVGAPIDFPEALAYRLGSDRAAGVMVSAAGIVGAAAGLVLWSKVRFRFELAPLLGMAALTLLAGSLVGLAFPSLMAGATTQFRASGRFAWPVLYAVPVLGLAGIDSWRWNAATRPAPTAASPTTSPYSSVPTLSAGSRYAAFARPRVAAVVLAVIVVVQLADTTTLRRLSGELLVPGGEVREEYFDHLVEVISAHDNVTLGPDFRCTYYPEGVVAFIDVTAAASAAERHIDRIYSARSGNPDACSVPQYPDLSDPMSVVFLIEPVSLVHTDNTVGLVEERCRKWETINICTHHWDEMAPEVMAFFGPVDD